MIALDSSAIVAIACAELEEELFDRIIVARHALVGSPTLVETRMVLERKLAGTAGDFLRTFTANRFVSVVPFTPDMVAAAWAAFERFGKGRGHPAQLNFGDCLSYAVAKTHAVPLLYKGNDFTQTDLPSAIPVP